MTRFRVGVLSALGITLALWSPMTPTQAQSPATAVHSVKITFAPAGDNKCQVESPVPQDIGVYRGDTLVWHVENACDVPAQVSITVKPSGSAPDVTKAFKVSGTLSSDPVKPQTRAQLTAEVLIEPALGTTYVYDYTVNPQSPAGLPNHPGKIIMCRQPPCPPPPTFKFQPK